MSRKKKSTDRHPRDTWAYFRTKDPVTEIAFTVRGDTVAVSGADPKHSRTEISYVKASGKPKPVSMVPSRDGNAGLDFHAQLKSYQYLFGVDTNYVPIKDRTVAVTAIYHCPERIHQDTQQLFIKPLALYLILEPKPGVNPELIGWHIALTQHLRNRNDGSLIGMVVDFDAGNLPDFNSHALPYLENNYLPNHVKLIYASADKRDKITNKIIRFCDKAASMAIAGLQNGDFIVPTLPLSETGLCQGIARITTTLEQGGPRQSA